MLPPFLRSVAETRRAILYRPEFNQITGSVTASILLQQVIYWADHSDGNPFYKFIQPCKHEKYRKGDSWSEETGFSKKEFSGAIAKIGTKVTKGDSKTEVLNGKSPENLVVYWTDASRVTWWQLNSDLAESLISEIYLGKLQKGIYLESDKRGFTYSYAENTTEIKEKNKESVVTTEKDVVVRTAKRSADLGSLRGGKTDYKAIASENISLFKSPEEKTDFSRWAVAELQKDYKEAIALDKASWVVRNLDASKDDLLATELLSRYRASKSKSSYQAQNNGFLEELAVLAKRNPSEARQRAVELATSKGFPENFYWLKIERRLNEL